MALKENTDPQQELIDSTEGIYLVDAGAGTGKTYSIVRRYNTIIENGTEPEDILLVTFTNNAAKQMKQKVIKTLSDKVSIYKLLEAPVMTFHSFCSMIIKKYGTSSPSYLGLKNYLPSNYGIIEDKEFESEIFGKFFNSFSDGYRDKYTDLLYLLENEGDSILLIIKKLCSLGVFPEDGVWSDDAIRILNGDYDSYSELFDVLNKPLDSKKGGLKKNILKTKFEAAAKDKLYFDFNKDTVFEDHTVNSEIKDEIFYDSSRDEYIEFLKDIYLEYLDYLLQRNLINFEFMIMFAYLTVYKNKKVREKLQFKYVMIDEFQDTDEIQFKLIMLLCRENNNKINLCVVGDWKQGIYGFRNTKIENITQFADNLALYKKELNSGEKRIEYDVSDFKKITFENNYRSSSTILEFSRETLFIKGNADEEVDIETIDINFKILKEKFKFGELTEIKFYKAKDKNDEYSMVLKKISELVNEKNNYRIKEYDKSKGVALSERPVKYSDICVLSRTKKFCLELQREAIKNGIPANYGGGLEIFSSEQGILVLAWLRLLSDDKDIKGWIPVLEKDGYSYPEIEAFTKKISESGVRLIPDVPEKAAAFLAHLRAEKNNILRIVEEILARYDFNDAAGNKIISIINSWNKDELISLNELIRIIDRSKVSEHKIDSGENPDAVLIQTIHSSKGMEYPVVIMSNVNKSNFPGYDRDNGRLYFHAYSGIRGRNFFAGNDDNYYKYDNWKTDLIRSICRNRNYDEERRLLYVAVTRAMQYVFFTAYSPSSFFTQLSESTGKEVIENFDYDIIPAVAVSEKTIEKIKKPGKIPKSRKFISPHAMMEEFPEEDILFSEESDSLVSINRDRFEFGKIVHEAANKIAGGIELESSIEEIIRIKKFIVNLKADELKAEIDFLYPKGDKMIRGTIDLLAFYDDRIEIIDYKTDRNRKYEAKYRIQLGIYRDVLKEIFKQKKIVCKIYYVRLDETVIIDQS